ncbi:hypothetical protein NQ318_009882 [Aromia moschata]|uniref:Uncharacterized protein n=1 Tax=Aromia moschata TaxID=1265417 RepID=A0AAV8Y2I8_9CUCU|nr:hypothetical protein NQ318_009882 [Aromia moschata]
MTYHADKNGSSAIAAFIVCLQFRLERCLKLAGKLLMSDHASGVATLVSEAFEKTQPKKNSSEQTNNLFSGFFENSRIRLEKDWSNYNHCGHLIDNHKNYLVNFFFQISSSISLKPPSQITKGRRSEVRQSLFDWVVNKEGISEIMSDVKDENLSSKVIEYIKERSLDEDTGCIQLLLCKSTPFIRKMQKSISDRGSSNGKEGL